MRRVPRVLLLPLVLLLVVLAPELATASTGYRWPVVGAPVVDRGFAPPRTPWGAGHRGVDLRLAVGAPVVAAGAGRVTYAGLLAGRGVVVVAHAGGLRTTYEPVAAQVAVGDPVAPGDVLGTLTAGHASCRARTTCLHWGLLRGDTYLNPLALLGLDRVRLLPLRPRDRPGAAAPAPSSPAPSEGGPAPAPRRTSPAPAASRARSAGHAGAPHAALPLAAAGVAAAGWAVRRRRA